MAPRNGQGPITRSSSFPCMGKRMGELNTSDKWTTAYFSVASISTISIGGLTVVVSKILAHMKTQMVDDGIVDLPGLTAV